MKTFEIFWKDLTAEAQERLKEFKHENVDLIPITTVDVEEET